MKKAIVNEDICDGSPFCPSARSCPKKAFNKEHFRKNGTWSIITDECIGCGICIGYCPQKAVSLIITNLYST
ncbi:MAG TPA: 4Fe-4S binding protein [Firmicutes bacterium]|nr:4Fe-4S binding protein [Bacillota bacterium]